MLSAHVANEFVSVLLSTPHVCCYPVSPGVAKTIASFSTPSCGYQLLLLPVAAALSVLPFNVGFQYGNGAAILSLCLGLLLSSAVAAADTVRGFAAGCQTTEQQVVLLHKLYLCNKPATPPEC